MKVVEPLEDLHHTLSTALNTSLRLAIECFANVVVHQSQSRWVLEKLLCEESDMESRNAYKMKMPDKRYSLSHCSNTVVAVGSRLAQPKGIGVDLEYGRKLTKQAVKLFLTESEQIALKNSTSVYSQSALRLWTVKEAVFKADLNNNDNFWFFDYETDNPHSIAGVATKLSNKNNKKFRYASTKYGDGFLTVAIAL
jgi:phosphopantetheinyl transferase (holo-ACP synthase)